ncbi:DNA cytosine methyltransferase [Sporanaerobacter acetigenes]|uniref:DNA (cytosine-5-)-methyltransferase n=1 Tax=Sporanaerobacter acetigenes DSM 13106 TaxID=1123281 RepID=A0A1M5YZR4_9FIRM|nr:DNA cytosine methyltransferase [Sporanaerobacter acetigenes]SHI17495.1 DNA (cytosine-5)-methyltransferase 1 [Sporanaerobacter acetigenes DSM 13106]
MKALSLFANVGIAETYLEEIGIDVVIANELITERANFYRHLYPNCNMIDGDITDESIFNQIIENSQKEKIDLIIATPPCQGMSIAGDMNPYDERNSLVKYAIDAVDILKPKFVFIENVVQQLTTPIEYNGVEIMIPDYIKTRLGKQYYINQEKIINTMDYGIPQMRKRSIILLSRKDTGIKWEFPKKENKVILLEEALKGIPDLWPIIREKEYRNVLPSNTEEALSFHKWHKPPHHVWRNVECMLYTPTGNTAFDNIKHYPKRKDGERISGYNTTYHRMYWNKPAPTVTRYNGIIGSQNNVHPGRPWKKDKNGDMMYTNPRVLTIYELMIVSTLPFDWNIPEWASNNLIRHVIGEGIPPLLVKKIIEPILNIKGV